jgi:hypothetical protein
MNTRRTMMAAASAALLAALAAPAFSHGPGYVYGPGMGTRADAMGGAQPERAKVRIEALRSDLKLAPNQAAAFDAWAAKVQTEAEARAKLRTEMRSRLGDPQAMSEFRVTMAKHNAEAAQQLHALRTSLYTALSAEQKKVLDGYGPGAGMEPRFGAGPGSRPGQGFRRGCMAV